MMNYDFEIFLTFGGEFLIFLSVASIKALVLAALIFLPVKIFRLKSPGIQHLLWIVVLLGMLLLPFASYLITPPISISVLPESLSRNFIRQPEFTAKEETQTADINHKKENDVSDVSQINQVETEKFELLKQDSETKSEISTFSNKPEILIIFSLLIVYLTGFAFMFIRFVRGIYKTRQVLLNSQIIDDEKLTNLSKRLIKKSLFCSQVKIFSSTEIKSPVTLGFFRPKILLPEDWINWEDLKIKSVLAHEAAHIRRKDFLVHLLATFNKCVNWFNPLSWIVARRISELAEISSDNSAINFVEDPHKYAEYLLEIAARTKLNIGKSNISGVTMVRDFQIVRRINLILQTDKSLMNDSKYLKVFIGGVALCTFFVAVILGMDLKSAKTAEILLSDNSELPIVSQSNETDKSSNKNSSKNDLTAVSEKSAEITTNSKSEQKSLETISIDDSAQSVQNSQKKQSEILVENNINLPINNPVIESNSTKEVVPKNLENSAEAGKFQFNEIGNESSIEELIWALNNSNPALREKAAAILKQKRDKRAVEPLIQKLTDGNAKVRRQAAETLGVIGDERAVKPLLNSLKDGNYNVRQMSSKALGDLDNNQAVEPLKQMINDNNQSVRQEAENSLRKLNKKIKE